MSPAEPSDFEGARLPCAALFQRIVALDTDGGATVCCVDASLRLEVGNVHASAGQAGGLRRLVEGRQANALRRAHVLGEVQDLEVCRWCVNDCYGRADPRDVLNFLLARTAPSTITRALEVNPYLARYLGRSGETTHTASAVQLGWGQVNEPVEPPENLVAALCADPNPLRLSPRALINLAWLHHRVRPLRRVEWSVMLQRLDALGASAQDLRDRCRDLLRQVRVPTVLPGRRGSDPFHWVWEPGTSCSPAESFYLSALHLPLCEADRRRWAVSRTDVGYEIVQFSPRGPGNQRSHWVRPDEPLTLQLWIRGPGRGRLHRPRAGTRLAIALEALDGRRRFVCSLGLSREQRTTLGAGPTAVTIAWSRPPWPEDRYRLSALVLDDRDVLGARTLPIPLYLSAHRPERALGSEELEPAPEPAPRSSVLVRRLDRPLQIEVVNVNLVGHCHLACVMCPYTGPEHAKLPRAISRQHFLHLLRVAAHEQVRIGVMILSWKGESLLHPEFLEIIEGLGDPELCHLVREYELVTNGQLLRRSLSDRILEQTAAGRLRFGRMQFSVDAGDASLYRTIRVGGELGKVEDRLGYFLEKRAALGLASPYVTVEIIPQSRNIEHLEHFIRKWLDIFARFGVRPHVAAEHHFEGDTIFAKPLAYAPEESGEDKARLLRQTRQVIDRVLT